MNNKKCLFFEVYKASSLVSLNESQAGVPEGMMRVTGVAAVIGVQNRNGRIYNKENYLQHINLLQQDIANGLYGELEHPEGFTINNNNISHKVEAVWFDDSTNEVKITILLLDTEKGKIAQSIIRSGGSLRVSSRAMGSVKKGNEAVIDKLVTYDIVGTPGFKETELHLSENLQMFGSDSLCESYVMYQTEEASQINENNINQLNKNQKAMAKSKNQLLLEQELAKRQGKKMNEQQFVTREFLAGPFADGMQTWLNEEYGAIIQNWVVESCFPLFETYLKRKAINESMNKPACSFGTFFNVAVKEAARLNESQQEPENGDIVLSQEEQDAMQKQMQGKKLSQDEQKLCQQGIDKMQQQQKKLQESQQEPENGDIVLSEAEEQALKKLSEGQQMDADELKQAQSGVQKQQQQQQKKLQEAQQQEEQEKLQQQQQQQEEQEKLQQQQQQDGEKQKDELRESLNEANVKLNGAYKRLLEAQEDKDQKQINQEIEGLKQEVIDIQTQIDSLSEGQKQQSKQCKDCMQKLQDQQELTQEDLDGLSEDELQYILDQQEKQQQQNEGAQNYDDPKDAAVFENQEKPLPTEDELKESLLAKEGAKVLSKSGSLLESLQQRMSALKK